MEITNLYAQTNSIKEYKKENTPDATFDSMLSKVSDKKSNKTPEKTSEIMSKNDDEEVNLLPIISLFDNTKHSILNLIGAEFLNQDNAKQEQAVSFVGTTSESSEKTQIMLPLNLETTQITENIVPDKVDVKNVNSMLETDTSVAKYTYVEDKLMQSKINFEPDKQVKTEEAEVLIEPKIQIKEDATINIKVSDGGTIDTQKPNFADEFAQKVISFKTEESQVFEMQLKPESLGKVTVKLEFSDGKAVAQVFCENAGAKEALTKASEQIRSIIQANSSENTSIKLNIYETKQNPAFDTNSDGRNGKNQQERERENQKDQIVIDKFKMEFLNLLNFSEV